MSFEDQYGRSSRGGMNNGRPAQNVNQTNSYNSLPMRNYNQSGYTNQPRSSGGNVSGGYQTSSYDRTSKTCSDNVAQLSINVGRIKSLTETLGTSKDSLSNREQLRHLIDGTRLIANDTSTSLKHLHDSVQEAVGTLDEKSRRVQYNKLLKDFQAWLGKFQEISKIAADKERTAPAPAPPAQKSKSNSHQYEDERDDDVKQGLLAAQRSQQMQFENEQNYMDAIIADREASIKEIERSVRDVNEIFQDLAHLVNEQGTMIDHIESNIDDSVARVEEGVVELRKANEYQKSSRNKMCCLALILLIVCGITVVVVYLVLAK